MYKEKLIELLSDYMDRTLSRGCLFTNFHHEGITEADDGITEYTKGRGGLIEGGYYFQIEGCKEDRIDKILGHFTMDSIMRYLANCNTEVILSLDKDRVHILTGNAGKAPSIPNKPLSTFTEEEYEALYNNLKGLGKN